MAMGRECAPSAPQANAATGHRHDWEKPFFALARRGGPFGRSRLRGPCRR